MSITRSNVSVTPKGRHGTFVAICGCKHHEYFNSEYGDYSGGSLRKRVYFERRSSYKELLERKLVEEKVKNICKTCLEYSELHFVKKLNIDDDSSNPSITSDKMDEDSIDVPEAEIEEAISNLTEKLDNLEWSTLSDTLKTMLGKLSYQLGLLIRADIQADSMKVASSCQDLISLTNVNQLEWYKERNVIMTKFISGCTGIDIHSTDKKINAVVHIAEQVLHAKNMNAITPFALKRNIVTYSLTRSKIAVQLYGGWESAGSYTTVEKLIKSPSPINKCPPLDIHVTVDNNQKVGKHSGRIRENAKQPVSICTTVGYIQPQPPTNLQSREDLHPSKWLDSKTPSELINDIDILEKVATLDFQSYRGRYISECIDEVLNQQVMTDNKILHIQDFVDIAYRNTGKLVCKICSITYNRTDDDCICPSCHHNPTHFPQYVDVYYRTESLVPTEKPSITIGEPSMVNPSSIENVCTVLRHVHEQTIEGCERNWTIIHSDGVPYVYAADVQDNIYICCICDTTIEKCDIDSHRRSHDDEIVEFRHAFDDFVLRAGPGHMEMNMAKTLLQFGWVPSGPIDA